MLTLEISKPGLQNKSQGSDRSMIIDLLNVCLQPGNYRAYKLIFLSGVSVTVNHLM